MPKENLGLTLLGSQKEMQKEIRTETKNKDVKLPRDENQIMTRLMKAEDLLNKEIIIHNEDHESTIRKYRKGGSVRSN